MNSYPGEGNGTPLQYSCLDNPMDGGAWWAAVHGVTKSRTRQSDFTFTCNFHALEKEMATHSRVPAWRIPGTGEPGGLSSMGSTRVGHVCSDLAAAAATYILYRNYPTTLISWHLTFNPLFCFTCWISSNILERVHSEVSILSCQACLGFCLKPKTLDFVHLKSQVT